MVLTAGMVGGEVDAQLLYDGADDDVALIADIIQALMIVRPGGEHVAMSARGRPFRPIEQQ